MADDAATSSVVLVGSGNGHSPYGYHNGTGALGDPALLVGGQGLLAARSRASRIKASPISNSPP